ncbi:MAG: lipocalin family protein [Cytophagaceae bacterium]|nr:lipocalin family protein [Cytophagaceae bacterium]MDW8457449.1 lipocalin family protein [Cytophagaceae bacterium]
MKRGYIVSLCYLFLLSVLLVSCKKDKDDPKPSSQGNSSSYQQRILGKWKITSFTLVSDSASIDYYQQMEDCEKDNILEFRRDSVLIFDEGPTKCNVDDPQQTDGTYVLSADNKKLTMTNNMGYDSFTWEIVELTNVRMKLIMKSDDQTTTLELVLQKVQG